MATDEANGVLIVADIMAGGPAETAGIRKGDSLLGLNGNRFGADPLSELLTAISGARTSPIVLEVKSGSNARNVTVTPARAP